MANHQFGLCRSCATINLPASSARNDSAENWADARAPSCFKVQKRSRTARSRRHGLSFPDRGQVTFPDCAARAALKATLGKDPREHWIIGSNDVASVESARTIRGSEKRSSNHEHETRSLSHTCLRRRSRQSVL